MNKREAAIVSAYTEILIGEFSEMHRFIEEVMGRTVFTHKLVDDKVHQEIKAKVKPHFISIKVV